MSENVQEKPKKRSAKLDRQAAFITAYFKNAFNASASCRECGIHRNTFKKWMTEDLKFVEELQAATDARLDEVESALMDQVRQGNVTAIIFMLKTQGKTRGYIEGSPVKMKDAVSARVAEILDGVLKGEIKPDDAGIMLDQIGQPIPEGLRLLIRKSEVKEPEVTDKWDNDQFEAEAERLYQETMAGQDKEAAEWVPQRQVEVKKIKDEVSDADSWSNEAKIQRKGGE